MSKKNKIRRLSDVIVDIRKEINNNESQENKDAVRVLLDEANQIIDENKKAHMSVTTPNCRQKCAACGAARLNGGKCDAK